MGASHPSARGHWNRALKDRDLSELLELRDQVADLVTQPGFEKVLELLNLAKDGSIQALLLPGPPLEQAEYAKHTGYAAGLAELPTLIDAIRETTDQRAALAERQAAQQEGRSS